jgi:hypothetical protein
LLLLNQRRRKNEKIFDININNFVFFYLFNRRFSLPGKECPENDEH